MNRKQKIIISITGIILVSLILVGLTYAYFLTKITGNTNTKSISVSTANLVLEYGENTNVVQGISNAEPGYSVEKIFTATNKGNSSVTYGAALENIVNELSRQEDLVYTLTCTSYLTSGFSLSSNGTITGTVDGTCNGVSTETKFPSTSTLSIMTTNTIDTTHTHAYKLTITYKEMGVDQSEDMNKTFSAKVNIVDLNAIAKNNPYSSNKNSLAYNIIENARTSVNGTELLGSPKTIPGKENPLIMYKTVTLTHDDNYSEYVSIRNIDYYITYGTGYEFNEYTGKFSLTGVSTCKYSDCYSNLSGKYLSKSDYPFSETDVQTETTDLSIILQINNVATNQMKGIIIKTADSYSAESVLSITSDDYGTSYYYRGSVSDNYVNFAEMCWKIVRIEGDGSVKLILEDYNTTCNSSTYTGNWSDGNTYKFGYDSNNKADFVNYSGGLADALKSFQTTKMSSYLDKLEVNDWCYDDRVIGTESYGFDDNNNKVTEKDKAYEWNYFEYYGSHKRIYTDKSPSLVCSGTKLTKYKDGTSMYVGTLTADEISFAGLNEFDYISNLNSGWWTLTPERYLEYTNNTSTSISTLVYYVENSLSIVSDKNSKESRPSVQLKSNIQITGGNGTKDNPYVVE